MGQGRSAAGRSPRGRVLRPGLGRALYRDRKVKLPDYREIPSVAEVALIDSERMFCEVHRRLDEGRWLVDLLRQPDAVLRLDSIGFAQPLAVLYANVALAVEPA